MNDILHTYFAIFYCSVKTLEHMNDILHILHFSVLV